MKKQPPLLDRYAALVLGLILSSLERGELVKATPGELLKATPQQSKAQANQSRMTEAMTTPMTIQITPT